jgi:putative membrane protein
MLEIVALAAVGCAVGVLTGLTPGLHVNTVCLLGLSVYASLGVEPVGFAVFMVAASVSHTFTDFIPGIFLGVPEEGTVLSVLPAHRLTLAGRAMEAVKLTGYGCLLGLCLGLLLLAPALYVVPLIYRGLRGVIVWALIAAVALLVSRERGNGRKAWSLAVFGLSGALGLLVLDSPGMSATYVLFPVFSGLFGLAGILQSLKERQRALPQEEYASVRVDGEVLGGGIAGALGGIVVGVMPAMSPSQIGILMSGLYGGSQRAFIVSVAAINASDAIYSLVSLYAIGNARSGVAVMISRILELDGRTLAVLVGVYCLCAYAALRSHLWAGRLFVRHYMRLDYRSVNICVMCFVVTLVFLFTGWFGLLVAGTSCAIGLLPILSGVSRTHLMGVLLVPTIAFFLAAA